MIPQIHPQEIYLLERYTSVDYFGELKDTWEEMVRHIESCLDRYMRDLPANYRSTRLPEQPDIVWGNRVLPNFRNTLQSLIDGFILLSHNDVRGLSYAHGPLGDFKGQMDYSSEWMTTDESTVYRNLLHKALTSASNICAAEGAYWAPMELRAYSEQFGPLNPPEQWPLYAINKDASIGSGKKVTRSGVYVPDVENSCAEFLSTRFKGAPAARILLGVKDLCHPITGEKYGEEPILGRKACVWYLVERTGDTTSTASNQVTDAVQFYRVPSGEPCPRTGFYITPASPESRRHFEEGEVMPAFNSMYGATIWQWDRDQRTNL